MTMAAFTVWLSLSSVILLVCCLNCRADISDCIDSDSTIFNCSGVGISNIPTDEYLPTDCKTLDLTNNSISIVTRLNISAENVISSLSLADNIIHCIQSGAFEAMKNLESLDLSGNVLDGNLLNGEQFYDLKSLQTLNMERNPVGIIKEDTFNFMELNNLRKLDLSHCEIHTIGSGGIDLPHLRHLDLSWNRMTEFRKSSFKMLVHLNTLDLSHNKLTVLDQMPYLPVMKVLNLDHNCIKKVSMRDEMEHLSDSLEHLHMRNNKIERFHIDSLPWDLPSVRGIYMDKNPIECDCQMKWMVNMKGMGKKLSSVP